MLTLRKAADRGHAEHGWLDSWHTFSFADYHDPAYMGLGPLRVLNDDRIQAGTGFGTHSHRDMEIISYVLEGALGHRDSMGNGSVIVPGDVQRLSAGTGIQHSERNAAEGTATHFLQIWIVPRHRGQPPGYEQKHYAVADKRGRLRLIASADGREGSVWIDQDVTLQAALVHGDEGVTYALPPGRQAYLHVARGGVVVNGQALAAGDAAHLGEPGELRIGNGADAEILLFDLPK
jgi:quercetin 2,3-dioxygenase